jgi:hypothetical protein
MAEFKLMVTDEDIDAAIERAKLIANEPRVIEAKYHPERGLDVFILKINDGRRLAIPREDLQGLENATPEQASDIVIGLHGTDLRWPQLDVDHYLPHLLEHRYGNDSWMERLQRRGVAA